MISALSLPLMLYQCLWLGRLVSPSHDLLWSSLFYGSAQGCPVLPLPWLLRPLTDHVTHLPSPSCHLLGARFSDFSNTWPSSPCPGHLEHLPDVTLESNFYSDLEPYQTLILETVHVLLDKHHTFKKISSQSDSTAGDLNCLCCKSISQQMGRRSPTHRPWKFYQEKINHNFNGREKARVWRWGGGDLRTYFSEKQWWRCIFGVLCHPSLRAEKQLSPCFQYLVKSSRGDWRWWKREGGDQKGAHTLG